MKRNMKHWIIQFCRPLIWATRDSDPALAWKSPSPTGQLGKVRYWNGGSWTIRYEQAKKYKNKEMAEAKALKLVVKEPTLIGEVEVAEFIKIAKPKK